MRKLKRIFLLSGALYMIIILSLYLFQEKILFQPERLSPDYVFNFDIDFEELFLQANDGSKLHGIHFRKKDPKGVILYFHGNRGSLKRWGKITSFFARKNYDVIVMDYRGYGKSEGQPTEENLYADAQLFYKYALKHYSEDHITVYGRSLGSGIAIKTASVNTPRKLILEAPYYSMVDVVQYWVPVFPVSYIIKYKFPSHEFVQKVTCDIVIYHGTKDGVVPYKSGEKLFENIPNANKQMIRIEGGSHNDLIEFDTYLLSIDQVLNKDIH